MIDAGGTLADVTPDTVDTGRTYGTSEAVVIRVVRPDGRLTIDDDGAAVRLAGRPRGWFERAERIAAATGLNVNRRGVVYVSAVGDARLDRLADLVATTSLEVYDALLEER